MQSGFVVPLKVSTRGVVPLTPESGFITILGASVLRRQTYCLRQRESID